MAKRVFPTGLLAAALVLAVLAVLSVLAVLTGGCQAETQPAAPAPNGVVNGRQPESAPTSNGSGSEPSEEFTLELPIAFVGDHLESTGLSVGLLYWLEASQDPSVANLPGRSKASAGLLFQPSLGSPTQETFWVHVITDESAAAATDWVKYVASQPPALLRVIFPQHELFGATFRPAPIVGDASVSIELRHGHTGGCWQTELLVFAQNGALVFLKSAIEITQERDASANAQSGGEQAAQCDVTGTVKALTDIDAIAHLISDRLSADR